MQDPESPSAENAPDAGRNDWPLPRLSRLLILARKTVAGIRRNVVRLADSRTSLRAVRKDDHVLVAAWAA